MNNIFNLITSKYKKDGLLRLILAAVLRLTGYSKFKSYTYSKQLKKVLQLDNYGDRFQEIYLKRLWGDGASSSGYGSTLDATLAIRGWLINNIPKLSIKKIVDAPCGDFFWMKDVISKVEVEYHGYDIVPELIKSNLDNYSSENVKFSVGDICQDQLPECDILLVRDCLFHLSFNDVSRFLQNIQHVKFKFLVTTNFIVDGNFINKDIKTGDYRAISLFDSPFNFPENEVKERICENLDGEFERELLVFQKTNVPNRLEW